MSRIFATLITPAELTALQRQPAGPLMVFDCSFDLADAASGEAQYRHAHIPGAVYAHLDRALSDEGLVDPEGHRQPHPDAASGGRHPLPSREKFAMWLSSVGFANDMQAVVYDRQGSAFCGRLWWMLKWMGHEAATVLDGGLQAWQAEGGAVRGGDERSVAGHIPGALNRPFVENFSPDGRFKPAEQLRAEFQAILAGREPATVVHHCGSGVSAVPNLIAMELAGLGPTGLYAGSWSEWCRDPQHPVDKG